MSDPAPVRRSVLVVEDEPLNRLVLERMLTRLGCAVETVANGHAALDRLLRPGIDLVLMDCDMPGIDGYATTTAIREREAGAGAARVRIIAVTAHDLPDDLRRCAAAGMDGHLAKPILLDRLAALVAA